MAKKTQPLFATGLLTAQDIQLYFDDLPIVESPIDNYFPLEQIYNDQWKTVENASILKNIAADPITNKSSIPVSGREGYQAITGDLATFGKAFKKDADDFEKWYKLQEEFATANDVATADKLLKFWSNDLANIQMAHENERRSLCYEILSNACSIGFTVENSPYLRGLALNDYPVATAQKESVGTSWSDPDALILDDIQTYFIDLPRTLGFKLSKIKVNADWFNYIRKNTQIQQYCATIVQNLFSTQAPPTIEAVNGMMSSYFGASNSISFEIIDEEITREKANGTTVTANPFKNGVAVGSPISQVGRFPWKKLFTESPEREVFTSFYMTGSYKNNTDVPFGKIYGKAKAFPAIDDYNRMIYLKIDATAW